MEESRRMNGSGSGGGKVFGRFTEEAHRVLDLAGEEAERFGHRYLGPEQTFGFPAVGEATWRVTRRRWWRGARVVWTPLCGPPLFAKRALQLASEQAHALNDREVRPGHLLLGVCEDARQPADMVQGSRRHRRIIAHVGLPEGYRGAAGPLLAVLGVDLDQLVAAVTAELGGVQR
jgi:Clp amino terminal domain, pathogenicity island component